MAGFLGSGAGGISAIVLEFVRSESKVLEDGLGRLGPGSALVMYLDEEAEP